MGKEKFKYFVSFVDEDITVHNAEVVRDTFIEVIDDIRSIEEDIKKDLGRHTITILNYRIF